MGDKYFYVKDGLTRFYGYQFTFMPSADLKAMLNGTKILPILSDPTSEDGDGDMLLDSEEYVNSFDSGWIFLSNPLSIDTDSDGYKDYYDPTPTIFDTNLYDREKAVEYALEWANSFNPEYHTSDNDCTNFVSQCLYAGGYKMTEDWFMVKAKDSEVNLFFKAFIKITADQSTEDGWIWTKSWVVLKEFYPYKSQSLYSTKELYIDKASNIENVFKNERSPNVGDIMIFVDGGGVCHATLITKVTDKEIYYSAHSEPRSNYELSEAIDIYCGVKIIYVRDQLINN
jgi:hypothetical protein